MTALDGHSAPKLRDTFAKRLKQARLDPGVSQRELGRHIGLSEDVVSSRVTRYERGTSEPDFTTADRLAQELNLPLASLLAETDVLAELIRILSTLTLAEQKRLLAGLRSRSLP